MAPARNLLRRQCDGYGGCFAVTSSEFHQEKVPVLEPNSMAEEEEEGDDNSKGWLQLGIGSHPSTSSSSSTSERTRSLELSLFPGRPPLPTVSSANPSIHPRATGYSFGHVGSSSTLRPVGEFRVVRPPPRPQAGVWFELKAAENQEKQPFLPQIPKSYLRIKDGRMTVRLVMKYLANKLGLADESQICRLTSTAQLKQVELTCRGQPLHPLLTLQHIRDNVWCTMPTVTMMPLNQPITDHVMILHYGRRA